MRLILLPFLCEMNRQNSIIIVGGDNTSGWSEKMSGDELQIAAKIRIKFLNLSGSNLDFIQRMHL